MSQGKIEIPVKKGECFSYSGNEPISTGQGNKVVTADEIFKCVDLYEDDKYPGIYANRFSRERQSWNASIYTFNAKKSFSDISKVECPINEGGRRRKFRKTRKAHKRHYSRRR